MTQLRKDGKNIIFWIHVKAYNFMMMPVDFGLVGHPPFKKAYKEESLNN